MCHTSNQGLFTTHYNKPPSMPLNKFLWDIYKNSKQGKEAIRLFTNAPTEHMLEKFLVDYHLNTNDAATLIDNLIDFTTSPIIPENLVPEKAEALFDQIIHQGIRLTFDNGEQLEYTGTAEEFLSMIPIISTWLFIVNPD